MNIQVNGQWRELAAQDLATALEELGLGGAVLATALNGEFVPVASRQGARLADGDRLEVLSPMQGG